MTEGYIISLEAYKFLPNENLVLRLRDPQAKVTYNIQLGPSEVKLSGEVIPVIRIRYWFEENGVAQLRCLFGPRNKISGAIRANDKIAVAQLVMALIQAA